MVFINIRIKSSSQLQPSETYKSEITIDNTKTVYDYFKILVDRDDMSKYNTYMYKNKCIGYQIPMHENLYKIFGTDITVTINEVSFTVPMNPFKRVNWLILLYEKELFIVAVDEP